jgi:hypothetical protein
MKTEPKFLTTGFLHIPGFVSQQRALEFLEGVQNLPSRRVICGSESVSWSEQRIPDQTPLFQFFVSEKLTALCKQCLGNPDLRLLDVRCWTSIYEESEFINAHCDRAGDIQVIVCLQSVSFENGGTLKLEYAGHFTDLHLTAGDALVFLATEVRHQTTPLISSENCKNPKRVIGVARYFFEQPILKP